MKIKRTQATTKIPKFTTRMLLGMTFLIGIWMINSCTTEEKPDIVDTVAVATIASQSKTIPLAMTEKSTVRFKGSLESIDDEKYYFFMLDKAEHGIIEIRGEGSILGEVVNEDGTPFDSRLVVHESSTSPFGFIIKTVVDPVTQTYLKVSLASNAFINPDALPTVIDIDYVLAVTLITLDSPDTYVEATNPPLPFDHSSTSHRAIQYDGDVDIYTLEAPAYGYIALHLKGSTPLTGLILNKDAVTTHNSGNEDPPHIRSFELPAVTTSGGKSVRIPVSQGTYHLKIEAPPNHLGFYDLTAIFFEFVPVAVSDPEPLEFDEQAEQNTITNTNMFDFPGQTTHYLLPATLNGIVEIHITGPVLGEIVYKDGDLFDQRLVVHEDVTTLDSFAIKTVLGSGVPRYLKLTAPPNSQASEDFSPIEYSFSLENYKADPGYSRPDASTLELVGHIILSDALQSSEDIDYYLLSPTTQLIVSTSMTGNADATVIIEGLESDSLLKTTHGADGIVYHLSGMHTYSLKIQHNDQGQLGFYELSLSFFSNNLPPPDGIYLLELPSAPNDPVTISVSPDGDFAFFADTNLYKIYSEESRHGNVERGFVDVTFSSNIEVAIVNASMNVISNEHSSPATDYRVSIPNSISEYYLRITKIGALDERGPYSFSALVHPDAPGWSRSTKVKRLPLNENTTTSTLHVRMETGDIDYYSFLVTEPGYLTTYSYGSQTDLDGSLWRKAEDGSLVTNFALDYNSGLGNNFYIVKKLEIGEYLLRVIAGNDTSTNSFFYGLKSSFETSPDRKILNFTSGHTYRIETNNPTSYLRISANKGVISLETTGPVKAVLLDANYDGYLSRNPNLGTSAEYYDRAERSITSYITAAVTNGTYYLKTYPFPSHESSIYDTALEMSGTTYHVTKIFEADVKSGGGSMAMAPHDRTKASDINDMVLFSPEHIPMIPSWHRRSIPAGTSAGWDNRLLPLLNVHPTYKTFLSTPVSLNPWNKIPDEIKSFSAAPFRYQDEYTRPFLANGDLLYFKNSPSVKYDPLSWRVHTTGLSDNWVYTPFPGYPDLFYNYSDLRDGWQDYVEDNLGAYWTNTIGSYNYDLEKDNIISDGDFFTIDRDMLYGRLLHSSTPLITGAIEEANDIDLFRLHLDLEMTESDRAYIGAQLVHISGKEPPSYGTTKIQILDPNGVPLSSDPNTVYHSGALTDPGWDTSSMDYCDLYSIMHAISSVACSTSHIKSISHSQADYYIRVSSKEPLLYSIKVNIIYYNVDEVDSNFDPKSDQNWRLAASILDMLTTFVPILGMASKIILPLVRVSLTVEEIAKITTNFVSNLNTIKTPIGLTRDYISFSRTINGRANAHFEASEGSSSIIRSDPKLSIE